MRALVTGGAGFLGSHLVERLLADGAEVVVVDDLSSGSRDNLPTGDRARGLTFLTGDVRDPEPIEGAMEGADVVFHLAGAVGVKTVAEDPVGTWSRNVDGTATVLAACAARGTRVAIASTSEVYGSAATGTLVEDAPVSVDPAARRDVYAVSKIAGESLAIAIHRKMLLPVVVARLFNVVGTRQSDRYGMVLPRLARAAVRGEPLSVHGDGLQTRCFLHVDDAVDALVALAESPLAEGQIVNVGSDEETSIVDLARRVAREAGTGAPIRFVPFAEVYGPGFADPPRRKPSLERIAKWTGWRPRKSLDDAVRDVVRHARELDDARARA